MYILANAKTAAARLPPLSVVSNYLRLSKQI